LGPLAGRCAGKGGGCGRGGSGVLPAAVGVCVGAGLRRCCVGETGGLRPCVVPYTQVAPLGTSVGGGHADVAGRVRREGVETLGRRFTEQDYCGGGRVGCSRTNVACECIVVAAGSVSGGAGSGSVRAGFRGVPIRI